MFLNGVLVRRREATADQPSFVELHLLTTIGAEPGPAIIAELAREADGETAVSFHPRLQMDPQIDFPTQLALDEGPDLLTAPKEVDTVPPQAVDRVRAHKQLALTPVPGIFRVTDPLDRGRTHWRHSGFHHEVRTGAGVVAVDLCHPPARSNNGAR